MSKRSNNHLTAGLAGAILGLIIFVFSSFNLKYTGFNGYFWGIASYMIWGGIITSGGTFLLGKIDPSSNFQIKSLAIAICFLVLMLFTSGQAWILQKGETDLLEDLDKIDMSAKLIKQQLDANGDWKGALSLLDQHRKSVNNIQRNLVMAKTLQFANIVDMNLQSLIKYVKGEKSLYEEKIGGNWNERVFVRSATPFFLEPYVNIESPMIYKNPVNSRPYNNDLLSIIYDKHVRND